MELDIATYRSFAETRLRGLKDLLLPDAADEFVVHVEVMNGLHQGSAADLRAADLTIGPDSDQDIMLVDDEVLGGTLRVSCRRSLLGPLLSLRTKRTGVTLNGKPVAGGDTTVTDKLPCEICINGIYLRFGSEEKAAPVGAQVYEKVALPTLVVVGVAALCGQIYLSNQSNGHRVVMPTQNVTTVSASAQKPTSEAGTQTAETMIAEAGLGEYLTLWSPSNGMMRITGQVPPDLMPQWRALRQDLDQQAQGAVVLADVTETLALTDLPPIAAVTLGQHPKIIFANKSFAHRGDRVAGDWIIEEITEDELRLRRGTEQINVTF